MRGFFFLSILSVLLFGLAGLSAQVPRYGVFEVELTSTTGYANKFTGTTVLLNVTAPSGTYTVRGFHDGGSTWRCRYLALEEGTHTWTTTSPDSQLRDRSGSFTVGPAETGNPFSAHGPVHIHPQHPHAVAHADGTPFLWNGDTEWFFLTHVSSLISQSERLAAIDFLASKKVNNLLMCLVNADDGFWTHPWPGTAGPSTRGSFDLARLRQWEETIAHMWSKGIAADLWIYSDDSTSILPAALSAEEDLLFRYLIARFGAYPNVTWNLALEFSEYRTAAWVVDRAALVKAELPRAFLAVHQSPGDSYTFPGNPHLDHTSLQRFTTHDSLNATVRSIRTATADAGRPIPVFHEEYAIEGANNPDPNIQRRDAWAIFMAGGFPKGASLGFWIGTPYTSGQHFDFQRIAFETVSKCAWWRMGPRNELVQSGGTGRYALASADEILVYSVSGASWTLDLSAYTGALAAEYVNPLTGALQAGTLSGGAVATIANPFGSGELALRVGGGGGPPPVNQAPIAADGSYLLERDSSVLVQLVYSDPDGPGPYTFQIVAPPSNGALTGSGNDRTYTPAAGFTGSDSFTWTVNDNLAASNVATVGITVSAPSSAPPAWPDAAMVTGLAVRLRWDDRSDNETEFRIERLTVSGGEPAGGGGGASAAVTLVSYAGTSTPPTVETTGANVFQVGARVVNDRTDTWRNVPADLAGLPRLLTARADRKKGPPGAMYVVSLPAPTTIYLPLDGRYAGAKLSWMGSEWTTSGLTCMSNATRAWSIWQRAAPSGEISLGTDEQDYDGMCFVFDVSAEPAPPTDPVWIQIAVVPADTTEHIDTIVPGEYSYRVRAANSAGASEPSNEVTVSVMTSP